MSLILLGCLLLLISNIVTADTNEEEPVSAEEPYSSPTPTGNYYLAENFDNIGKFKEKWLRSQAKKDGVDDDLAKYDGEWEIQPPVKDSLSEDLGLVLKSKAKHAAIAAYLDKNFHFNDRPFIVQYEVNFQEGQECGGAYLKLLSLEQGTLDLKQFTDKTPYTIMFGPDKCGNDHKLHFIFRHKNPNNGSYEEKHAKKPKERIEDQFKDKNPHLYTLILKPDNKFQIQVDHKIVNEGSLLDDFTPPVNPESEIDDPNDEKPETWDEREKIPDLTAKKPDDWDEDAPPKIIDSSAKKPEDWLENETLMIPDPTAEKPEDWDTDMDGEWEAPLVDNPICETVSGCGPWEHPSIDNPAYKGKWRAPYIDNPNYQGKWKPRKIPNPNYFHDAHPFRMTSIGAVGFELWSMSPMILIDNIIITDSLEVAKDYAAQTYDLKKNKIDKESESALSRFLNYSNERPWLYAVYVIALGIPITLFVVYCCSESKKDSDESGKDLDAKKTDIVTPDDIPKSTQSKSQLEIPDEVNDEEEDDKDEEEGEDEDENDKSEAENSAEDEETDKSPNVRKRISRKD